jgi:hypothetical protein
MRAVQPVGSFWPSSRRSGVLLLVLVLACTACGSSTSFLSPATTVSAGAPRPVAASAWEQIAFPAPAPDVQGVAVSPTDPATLFACTAHLQAPQPDGGMAAEPMTLWRTTDAGAHWTRYDPVLSAGTACFFSIAPDDPGRVTLQVSQTADHAQPCARDSFYLSSDGGSTWQRMPPHASIAPKVATYGWCDLHVSRRHLYLDYSFAVSNQAAQVSLLERSDDNGVSWTRADHGLGDNVLFTMPEIGPEDALAVTVIPFPVQIPPTPSVAHLWVSTNAGTTWQRTSALPEGVGTFLLHSWPPLGSPGSPGNTWPTSDHPFYALEHEQMPSYLYRERVLMSGDGHTWSFMPSLPVAGTSADRPGVLQVLSVLSDGRLAIWGPDPHRGLPADDMRPDQFPTFWLWLWDPAAQHWQVVSSALNAPASEGCGLYWEAQPAVSRDGTTYLFVSRSDAGTVGKTLPGLFRVRLPKRP